MWYDHDAGWAGWIVMGLGMAGFWVLLGIIAIAALRGLGSRQPPATPDAAPDARAILDQRFARGEIDLEEYNRRRAALTEVSG
jgi:putative membrane protein